MKESPPIKSRDEREREAAAGSDEEELPLPLPHLSKRMKSGRAGAPAVRGRSSSPVDLFR